MLKPVGFLLFLSLILFSCATTKKGFSSNTRLTFIDEYRMPNELYFQNTLVGGLSGIDYNPAKDEYYIISDERSATSPARFYTAKIRLGAQGIDSAWFTGVSYLLNPQQELFPRFTEDTLHSCDPEGIRYNSKNNMWTWCSEGERFLRQGIHYLQDPWVYNMNADGGFIDSFLLPPNMRINASEKGPRRNSSFEGLSFSIDYNKLFVSVEEPLYEDGQQAATKDTGAWTRIIRFDTKTRKPDAQFAYRVEPVGALPVPAGAFKINGISDILVVGKNSLLVVERSFSTRVRQNTIRVYLAGLESATDVSAFHSLTNGDFKPASKKLLVNMDALGSYTDNIEGVCLGPKLPNGKQSLLFISDNNFRKDQVTQVLLFQID